MHFSSSLIAVAAAAATSVSACTFAIDNTLSIASFGGGGVACRTFIYANDDADVFNDTPDATGDITCDVSGGCADLEYNGQTYTFCHDGIKEQVDIVSTASVQRKPDGVTVNLFPDGEDKADSNATPVDQFKRHVNWRGNINCP